MLQGERPLARDNRTLGRFQLVGLPPAPRGVPQVEVAFDIDANGIVNVTAKDMATGKEQKITISGSSGLSKDEVDRMVKDAQSHAAEDQARRELIDARNQADSLAYQVEKTVNENRERLPVGELSRIEAAIAERPEGRGGRRPGGDQEGDRGAAAGVARARRAALQGFEWFRWVAGRVRSGSRLDGSDVKDGEVVDAEYAETRVNDCVIIQRRHMLAIGDHESFVGIRFVISGSPPATRWMPPVDIYQNGDHELVLKAELPDMTREDIDITVENGTLTIKGEKKFAGEVKEEQFHRVERRYGVVQPVVLAAADGRREQGRGRVQERRADRAAAAARGSQAAADQGGRRGVTCGQAGRVGRAGTCPPPVRLPACPSASACYA